MKNKLHLIISWLFVCCLVVGVQVRANELSPLETVDVVVRDVVADMNANQEIYQLDEAKLRAMVLERVARYFNFKRMTQLALAKHWKEATVEQRRQVSDEMLHLMVRTYANAVFTYRNHPLNLVDEKILNPRSALVRLAVKTDSGQNVSVMLRMENRENGWQVMDVVIDGVSMVITYRGTFAEEISKSGIDGLIESIRQENLARAAP